jgi:predicted nucleotide-binding protein
MIERYRGREGKRLLHEVLLDQQLVRRHPGIATGLCEQAELMEFREGEDLYVEAAPGKSHLYFVISGSVQVIAKGRAVCELGAGNAFGEFPILDPSLAYTVTIRAVTPAVVARVTDRAFAALAGSFPDVWKNMACSLMRRLMASNDRLAPARKPCVFIGHGRANAWLRVQAFVKDELRLECEAFESESESRAGLTITELIDEMRQKATFAVLVMTAEDATAEGGKRARQNVIHEAGLFQGALGTRRALLLLENGVEEFSNAAGIIPIKFEREHMEPALKQIQAALAREGQIRLPEAAPA